jgi:hypothetical protein
MTKKRGLWRALRVGDKIRLVEIPPEFLQEGYYIHRSTMQVYKKLVARRRPLRISEIDEYGIPWIRYRCRRKDGQWEYPSLAFDHGGLLRVKSRKMR